MARQPALAASPSSSEPNHDCPLCPRLVAYRQANRHHHPDWFNGPVPSFGAKEASLLIVGLAPGVQGANRTGRPFTGDYAGDLLYETLTDFGFAKGQYAARPDDGLALIDCRISNAVRCVPPQNKPEPFEINTCRSFLANAIRETAPRAIVSLGKIAHDSTLKALGISLSKAPFAHSAEFEADGIRIFSSYHCSRYNTNTRRLTRDMFRAVFQSARQYLDAQTG